MVGARGGIGYVVGADDQGYVGLREVAVDFVHVEEPIVRDVGFGEEHVHVAGHAAGNRVDGEFYVYAALAEGIEKFADFVLRLRDGHAVAGYDDDFVGGGENSGGFFGAGAANSLFFDSPGSGDLHLTKGAEKNVGKRAVHRFRHDDGEDETGRAVEGAGDDEELAVEDEAHRGGRETGVGIQ